MKSFLAGWIAALCFISPNLYAQSPAPKPISKTLLETKITFDAQGKAQVTYNTHSQSPENTATNKIQSVLMFYAYTMKSIEETARTPLLNQVQKSISKVATEQGLKRADLLSDNTITRAVKPDASGKGFTLVFAEEIGKGNSFEVVPNNADVSLLPAAVFYNLQDLTNNLPDSGLRFMVLALGGTNKWYREIGKANDANSVAQASGYGLNLAADILAKISGKKI